MEISSQQIEEIVKRVVFSVQNGSQPQDDAVRMAVRDSVSSTGSSGDYGVFEHVDDAVEAAWQAQKVWATQYKIEDRKIVLEAIRRCARAHVEEWCHKIVEETGMGRYEDKVEKHLAVVFMKCPF